MPRIKIFFVFVFKISGLGSKQSSGVYVGFKQILSWDPKHFAFQLLEPFIFLIEFVEACELWSQICQSVHDNLLKTDVEILYKLLQSGDSAQKYMQDNLVQGHGATGGARIKDYQSHSKRSRKHMSMKHHKKCGSFDLPKEFHNSGSYEVLSILTSRFHSHYEYFKPMHEMWKGYITQLLKNVGKNQLSQCLMAVDLHGAILLVVPKKPSIFILQTD
ncbi:hypothetical protein MKX01_025019 [Papaver californicum]|nr:hypothetical protein MKX01_025019 [Papaver californicum]